MTSSPSIPAASAAPVISKSAQLQCQRQSIHSCLSFPHSLKPSLLFLASQGSHQARCAILKAQLNEVSLQGLSNASVTSADKLDASKPRTEDVESAKTSFPSASVSDSTLSDFMAEVANLVKLVDSRDIIELQLKQNDCELIIKKKEALPQIPIPAPMVAVQTPAAQSVPPSHLHPPAAAPSPAPSTALVPSLPSPAVKSSHSSHPPLKCPMAGTFYRSPEPGEPPFVKVGDKVKKGQVLCIIEAMKLMNEIEADQSGTLVEVLADDGKPVSVDMPLFVIEP